MKETAVRGASMRALVATEAPSSPDVSTASFLGAQASPATLQQDRLRGFLSGLFLGTSRVRALDFGGAVGRRLRHMLALQDVDVQEYSPLAPPVAAEMKRSTEGGTAEPLATCAGAAFSLPYSDGAFDVVFVCDVLTPPEAVEVARELWRVTTSLIIHLIRSHDGVSQGLPESVGALAFSGLDRVYDEAVGASVRRFTAEVDGFLVYAVGKPTSRAGAPTWKVFAERRAQRELLASLQEERRESADWRERASQSQRERDALATELARARGSPDVIAAQALLGLPGIGTAVRSLARVAERTAHRARRALGVAAPAPHLETAADANSWVDLPFASVATRATHEDPLDFVRSQPRVVALCHPEWRGIRAATYGQSTHVLEVPGVFSEHHCERLANFLRDSGVKKLVVNGYPPGVDQLLLRLAREAPEIGCYFVYHGGPALGDWGEHRLVQRMLELHDAGGLEKLGFVKPGFAEYFRARGYPAEYVMNICRVPVRPPRLSPDPQGALHVGVFAPRVFHKNVDTQLIAALLIPGTVVHTCAPLEVEYLKRDKDRVVVHGILPRDGFLGLLEAMHATTYVSLTECYPMTVLESVLSGAVCLTSQTSSLFDGDPELREALVVPELDNPSAIAARLSRALDRRADLVPRAQAHVANLNLTAEQRWRDFLEL